MKAVILFCVAAVNGLVHQQKATNLVQVAGGPKNMQKVEVDGVDQSKWLTPKQEATIISQGSGRVLVPNVSGGCLSRRICPELKCAPPLKLTLAGDGCCHVCWAP